MEFKEWVNDDKAFISMTDVAGSIYFLFWVSNGNQFSLILLEAVAVPINTRDRTAYGRCADQRGCGYETLKLTIISKSEIINEPLVLAIQELPGLCGALPLALALSMKEIRLLFGVPRR